SVFAERESHTFRECLPDGSGRRCIERDGAAAASAGGSVGRGKEVQQIISLLMENKPGALMRVTGLLSQRGYNIETLTVARTLDPTLSRMTISVDVEPNIRGQVIKQMNKLINVLQAM